MAIKKASGKLLVKRGKQKEPLTEVLLNSDQNLLRRLGTGSADAPYTIVDWLRGN
jgi:hypothetical protein